MSFSPYTYTRASPNSGSGDLGSSRCASVNFSTATFNSCGAAMAGAVDARQMALADAQLAARAILGIHRQRARRGRLRALPILLVDRLRLVGPIGIDHVVRRRDKLLLHHFSWSVQQERRGVALGKFRPFRPDLVGIGELLRLDFARQLLPVLIHQVVRREQPRGVQHARQQQAHQNPHRQAEGRRPHARRGALARARGRRRHRPHRAPRLLAGALGLRCRRAPRLVIRAVARTEGAPRGIQILAYRQHRAARFPGLQVGAEFAARSRSAVPDPAPSP